MNIDKELKEYKLFKNQYKFNFKQIEEINGELFCDGISLLDEEGNKRGLTEKWLNVGYNNKGCESKVLSNLFHYEFTFRNIKLNSIESFFQGIKFKDKEIQKLVFTYSGKDSNYIKGCTDYNWKENGIIYFQGKEIDRFSQEYEDLVNELYVSAIQNPLYRLALKKCDVYIMHSIGDKNKKDSVLTRYEFEYILNSLKDFIKNIKE